MRDVFVWASGLLFGRALSLHWQAWGIESGWSPATVAQMSVGFYVFVMLAVAAALTSRLVK